MRGDIAHHAFDRSLFGVDHHPLRLGDGRINAAHLAHIEEALLVDIIDDHGDFVRVGGQHQAGGAALVEHRHRIAVGVAERFVGERFDIIEPDPLAGGFVARRAGSVDQPFEKLDGFIAHGSILAPGGAEAIDKCGKELADFGVLNYSKATSDSTRNEILAALRDAFRF